MRTENEKSFNSTHSSSVSAQKSGWRSSRRSERFVLQTGCAFPCPRTEIYSLRGKGRWEEINLRVSCSNWGFGPTFPHAGLLTSREPKASPFQPQSFGAPPYRDQKEHLCLGVCVRFLERVATPRGPEELRKSDAPTLAGLPGVTPRSRQHCGPRAGSCS